MAKKAYSAFEGLHTIQGNKFLVSYMDLSALKPFNANYPPGHADRWKAGWYWMRPGAMETRGAFTSSRRAYQDAVLKLGGS